MKRFIEEHEAVIEFALSRNAATADLREYHERQIKYLQAERIAHLHVTLAVGLFVLISAVGAVATSNFALSIVSMLLLALLAAYIAHYYRLENATQRWYKIARRLDRLLGRLPKESPPGKWE